MVFCLNLTFRKRPVLHLAPPNVDYVGLVPVAGLWCDRLERARFCPLTISFRAYVYMCSLADKH